MQGMGITVDIGGESRPTMFLEAYGILMYNVLQKPNLHVKTCVIGPPHKPWRGTLGHAWCCLSSRRYGSSHGAPRDFGILQGSVKHTSLLDQSTGKLQYW